MNENDNKPVDDTAKADTFDNVQDDTKVEVKFGKDKKEADNTPGNDVSHSDKSEDEIDITAALKDSDETNEVEKDSTSNEKDEPEEEQSDIDKELERVEGIESASHAKAEPVVEDESPADADDKNVFDSVDLETQAPDSEGAQSHNEALAAAMRSQEKQKATSGKKRGPGVLIGLLAALFVLASVAAGYFYMDAMAKKDDLTQAEDRLASVEAQVAALRAEQAVGAEETAVEYREIPELGVRYVVTDENADFIYSYMGAYVENRATVGFSTLALSDIREGEGTEARNPCDAGALGMISRIEDAATKPGDGEVTRQVGDETFVFVSPQAVCTDTVPVDELEAMTAQLQAVFEALEKVPAKNAEETNDEATATEQEAQAATKPADTNGN